MIKDDDKPFEADVDFMKQREYFAEYSPLRSYFFDWLSAIYWELQGTCGPIEYATRVSVSRELLDKVNTEHALSSHMVLKRIIKNLFPYDQILDKTSQPLRLILGNQRGKVRFNKYRTLKDHCIKSNRLITMRYKTLADAFCMEVRSIVELIRERIEEEYLPDYLDLGDECLRKCAPVLDELITIRKQFYSNYPEEHLRSVSNASIKNEDNLKKRSDMPKDMEPEYLYQLIAKHTTSIRNDLQAVLIQAKEICATVEKKKKQYHAEVNELLVMSATIRTYVSDGPFSEITGIITELGMFIEKQFALSNYLPADILNDLNKGNSIYKNGYL